MLFSDVMGCKDPSAPMCVLSKGTSLVASVTLKTNDAMPDITSATTEIHAQIGECHVMSCLVKGQFARRLCDGKSKRPDAGHHQRHF